MKYARVLLENCPNETTELFVEYFTGRHQQKRDVVVPQVVPQQPGYAAGAVNAVQNLRDLLPLPYMNPSAVTSPATQGNVAVAVSDGQLIETPDQLATPSYTPPQPRTAFSSFVDHPDEFIVFLEACLKEKEPKGT